MFDTIINKLDIIYNKKDYRCNVIYITTKCNFRCEYCFENNEKHKNTFESEECSIDDINEFIDDIFIREFDLNGKCIVIMGGEPFLAFDKLKYLFERCKIQSKIFKKSTNIIIFTNASYFGNERNIKKYKDIIDYYKYYNLTIEIAISYDGSGQALRIKKKNYIENILDKLFEYNINFKLSYTINRLNYLVWKEDLDFLINRYRKNIFINITRKDIEERFDEFNYDSWAEEILSFNPEYITIYGIDKDEYLPNGYTRNKIYKLPNQKLLEVPSNCNFTFDKIYKVNNSET